MSAAKHTPGPWHIDENGSSISSDAVTDLALLNMVNVRFSWGGSDFATKSHRLANARLIAAAPELLEALQDLLRVAKRELADPEDCGAINSAESAISKATGGQQ